MIQIEINGARYVTIDERHTADDPLPGYRSGCEHRQETREEMTEPTPSTAEGTDLADGGRNTIELAAHSGRTGLRSEHTQAVTGSKLSETEEEAIHDLD